MREPITIAILPFRNLIRDEEFELILPGFTEDLISNLSKFTGISVISYFTTAHIKDIGDKEAIDSLNADYIVTGSFKKAVDGVKVSVHLNNVGTGQVILGHDYELNVRDIYETLDEILQKIVATLQQNIDNDILSHSYKKKSIELAAYENYLIGMENIRKGSLESDEEARKYFKKALDIDPNFATAYTGLSLSHYNEWSCRLWERWDVSHSGAHDYALKAIEVDPNDYKALAILGRTYLFSDEFIKAEHCVRKSLRMNPNDASNLIQIAFSLMYLGYASESVELYEKARKLNPHHNDIYFAYGSNFHFEAGNDEISIELAKKAQLKTCWVDFPAYVAASYFYLGDLENMSIYWQKYLDQFKAHIKLGSEDIAKDAIKWQIKINPYKNKTRMRKFWDHILEGDAIEPVTHSEKRSRRAIFKQDGDIFNISYGSNSVRIKSSKGLKDIQFLLAHVNEEIHCMEIMKAYTVQEGTVDLIDEKARKEYQKKLLEIQDEIKESEEMNDLGRIESLNIQYEAILDHLSSSLAKNETSRKANSSVEKARTALTWRIRDSIKKINKLHPDLGKHLQISIKTGSYCGYLPETDISWDTV